MRSRSFVLVTVFASAPACATLTPEQVDAARRVQVRTVSPAVNCQNLGPVSGSPTSEAASGMRAHAVRLGGNTLTVNADGTAMVFYCPDFAVPTPDADPQP